MKQMVALTVMLAVSAMLLSACGKSAYCGAVEDNEKTLRSVGKKQTDKAFLSNAEAFRALEKNSSGSIRKNWKKLAKTTERVIRAQNQAGITIQEMSDKEKVRQLDSSELAAINEAYKSFNKTIDVREAVVKNVLQECSVQL